MRSGGILLHISSLPNKYGIGTFGESAYEFVRFLEKAKQDENVRKLLKLDPAEVLIMFIGIGNYPDECQTTRSERKSAEYTVV